MILWSIKIILLSIILIFVLHNLFGFFKDTLTTPKVKDLVQQPTASYKNIEELIAKEDTTPIITNMDTKIVTLLFFITISY